MRSPSEDKPFLLITIPQSHFCEKARWALERLQIAYQEEPHLPFFHLPATLLRGGKRTTPVLKTRAGVFDDSTEILLYLEQFATEDKKLYPSPISEEVKRLEDLFDQQLGPATRLWVYFHMLPDKELALSLLDGKVPAYQSIAAKPLYSFVKLMMKQRLGISRERATRAEEVIREVFEEVARKLQDGRPFLTGDRFTAADLTFASLAAPILFPAEYGGPLPKKEQMPPEVQPFIQEMQSHPAGRFGLKLFREKRH